MNNKTLTQPNSQNNMIPNPYGNSDQNIDQSSPKLLHNYVSKNVKEATEQISGTTPFQQTKILNQNMVNAKENFNKINHNLKQIIENVRIITSKLGPISGFPCEISKFLTSKICDMNSQFEKMSSMVSPKISSGLQKLQTLSEKSLDDSQNLMNQVSNSSNTVGKNLAKLTDTTSKMGQTVNKLTKKDNLKQQAGGSLKNNKFEYIVNPLTGRKVNVKSDLGRKIILSYITNYN